MFHNEITWYETMKDNLIIVKLIKSKLKTILLSFLTLSKPFVNFKVGLSPTKKIVLFASLKVL